jgi:uncharacterized protein (DUF2249 family)
MSDGHRVILRVISHNQLEEGHQMTVISSIDPARLLEEQLA